VKRPGITVFLILLSLILIATAEIFFETGLLDRLLGVMKKEEVTVEGAVKLLPVRSFTFEDAGGLEGWGEKILANDKTEYSIVEHQGSSCVKGSSVDTASTLFIKQKLSCARDIYVSWDWMAEKFPERKDPEALDKKKEFDFVAQVYVVFHARFFLNSKAIQYVWTEELPVGTVCDSPYTKNVKLLVLQSGLSEGWKHEQRDIKKDFRELFGKELEKDVDAVAFMTDADSTGTSAVAYYDNVSLGYVEKNVREK